MKLRQNFKPKFIYEGVNFPKGEAVVIPTRLSPKDVHTLKAWGFEEVNEPTPAEPPPSSPSPPPVEEDSPIRRIGHARKRG